MGGTSLIYVGIVYRYCFVSPSQFPSGWDPPMSLSPNHRLYKVTLGWDPRGFFLTVVILLLPLLKKVSIPPQVFEQSMFLFPQGLLRLPQQLRLLGRGRIRGRRRELHLRIPANKWGNIYFLILFKINCLNTVR